MLEAFGERVLRCQPVIDADDDGARALRDLGRYAIVGVDAAQNPAATVHIKDARSELSRPQRGGLVDTDRHLAKPSGKRRILDRHALWARAAEALAEGVIGSALFMQRLSPCCPGIELGRFGDEALDAGTQRGS